MKRIILSMFVFASLNFSGHAQTTSNKGTVVPSSVLMDRNVPMLNLLTPDIAQIQAEDEIRDRNGELYRIGVAAFTNITTENSGLWKPTPEGGRKWQLHVKFPGAEALSFLLEKFRIYENTTMTVQDMNGKLLHKILTREDVLAPGQQNIALCFGDEMVLTIHEPQGSTPSEIYIDRIIYNYRATGNPNVQKINESDPCEVNVNCTPAGDPWQEEKRGVARIYIVDGAGAGWCSGTLINNTAQDCTPYFLTALHCGVTTSASQMNQWRFYFRYESPNCNNPSSAGTLDDYFITGCVRIADSGDGGGNSGSDFLLVKLGNSTNQTTVINNLKSSNFNAYWVGWNANATATTGGASIHHPAGDIKKLSTFTGTTVSTQWGSASGSHWRVVWTANANGHGVTEGGSSGSALFNSSQGYLIGTLTGGSSFCTSQSAPDLYGKMSYHWQSNGTANNRRLKPWLDPGNTGAMTLAGSADPCSAPAPPIADFVANQTNVAPGTTVNFTDLSTGVPTSWAWTVSPATGWAYAGGTSANSQNPQITFNTIGQYTISLTAANGIGNDTETKTNYIIVSVATTPCTATSTNCDEYISNVTLNTINNTTACTNYGNYTGTSTTLNKGAQYTVTVSPTVTGQGAGAYTNDEIAVWIDWNDDLDFIDAGEQVGYVLVGAGWSNQFTFTVPMTAVTGTVTMRCRLSYQPDDGAITPCGDSQWGEVEDYSINIQAAPSGVLTLQCPANSTIYATQSTVVPNVTATATSSTTCAGGVVNETQSPAAGAALQNGSNVITVTATDQCGNTQTCTTTITYINNLGIEENPFFINVAVYPNPFNESLVVDLSSIQGETVDVMVYDITGKLISTKSNEENALIIFDVHGLSKGVYQIQMISEKAQTVRRVLKL